MIKYQNINLSFKEKEIFKDFNLEIFKNEKIIFNAPSGKGKSLLLKMLLGFVKPDSGEVLIENKKLSRNTIKKIRSKIAYVSQNVNLRKIKVDEFFNEIFLLKNNRENSIEKLGIKKLLEKFLLDENILNKNIKNLSGGERQRIAIIAMLLLDKEIILLDEVTSSLEKDLKQKIADYILDLDKTVLAISHDKEWIENKKKSRVVSW